MKTHFPFILLAGNVGYFVAWHATLSPQDVTLAISFHVVLKCLLRLRTLSRKKGVKNR